MDAGFQTTEDVSMSPILRIHTWIENEQPDVPFDIFLLNKKEKEKKIKRLLLFP